MELNHIKGKIVLNLCTIENTFTNFRFESEDPVDFAENRQKILDALDEAGWPIKEQDIYLLEEEIKRGNKFIQQSKDLRKAANEKADDDLGVYEDHASIVSGLTTSRDYEVSCA